MNPTVRLYSVTCCSLLSEVNVRKYASDRRLKTWCEHRQYDQGLHTVEYFINWNYITLYDRLHYTQAMQKSFS